VGVKATGRAAAAEFPARKAMHFVIEARYQRMTRRAIATLRSVCADGGGFHPPIPINLSGRP
jgi:hypothetical protein